MDNFELEDALTLVFAFAVAAALVYSIPKLPTQVPTVEQTPNSINTEHKEPDTMKVKVPATVIEFAWVEPNPSCPRTAIFYCKERKLEAGSVFDTYEHFDAHSALTKCEKRFHTAMEARAWVESQTQQYYQQAYGTDCITPNPNGGDDE